MMLHDDIYTYLKSGPLSAINWICGDEDPQHMLCNGALHSNAVAATCETYLLTSTHTCVHNDSPSYFVQVVRITSRMRHRMVRRRGWPAP